MKQSWQFQVNPSQLRSPPQLWTDVYSLGPMARQAVPSQHQNSAQNTLSDSFSSCHVTTAVTPLFTILCFAETSMETEHRANYFELEEDEADVDIGSFGPVYDECRSCLPCPRPQLTVYGLQPGQRP